MCKREGQEAGVEDGYIKSGFACHHVIPFESARSQAEMERLFFDVNNIILVCKDCHAKIHREMKSHTKEKVAERKAQRRSRFLERNDPNFASEREQDDACISHAEREQSRTECNYRPDDDPNKPHI